MGRHINETAKRHILGQKDVIWRIDRQNRSTGATCARDEETKKRQRKKPNCQLQTGYSPRPPTSSDRNEILHNGRPLDISSKIRISSKSVKRFQSCGGRNLPISIDLAIGLYNSYTSRDKHEEVARADTELDVGWVHPWVGLDWAGS